jgi:uncharacterized protein YegL
MGVGVGGEADSAVLTNFCDPAFPPRRLKGLAFREMFRWLSQTLRTTTRRAPTRNLVDNLAEDDDIDDFAIHYDA